jgi:hypothetical protein
MIVQINFIMGVNLGFEFVEDVDDDISWLVIDMFILRFMIGKV